MISKHFLPKYTPAEIKRCYYTLQHFIRMAEVDDSNAFLRSQAQAAPFFMQTFEPPPKRASILPTTPSLERLGMSSGGVAAAAAAMQQQFLQQQEMMNAQNAFALPADPRLGFPQQAQQPQQQSNTLQPANNVYNVSFNFPSPSNLAEIPLAFNLPAPANFLTPDNTPSNPSPAIHPFGVEATSSTEFVIKEPRTPNLTTPSLSTPDLNLFMSEDFTFNILDLEQQQQLQQQLQQQQEQQQQQQHRNDQS